MSNQQLVNELHKPIIKELKKNKSLFFICGQCLGHWSCRYAINKQV